MPLSFSNITSKNSSLGSSNSLLNNNGSLLPLQMTNPTYAQNVSGIKVATPAAGSALQSKIGNTTQSSYTPSAATGTTLTPTPNPNGLSNQQVAAGYSTIQGNYDPVTGKPKAGTGAPVYIPPGTTSNTGTPGNGTTANAKSDTPSFGGILADLLQKATQGSQGVQNARTALTDFQTNTADQIANIKSQAIPIQFQQGRAQVVQQAAAQKESALQTGVQNALTDQQQQLTALNSAAGLAQPSTAQYGQTVFNPITGQYEGNSGLPDDVLNQYATMAANGQYSAIPSAITSNPVLSAQLNQAAKAINPNYNPITSTAQGSAQAANVQTSGTIGTQTAATGYSTAIQQYNNMSTQNSAADAQAQNVQNILSSTGINASNSQDWNSALNKLSGRLGSTQVTQLMTSVAELQNIYSQLLTSGGGTPTGNEQQALAVLNPNSTPAQINASIQQLQIAAYNKLNAQYGQAQTYYSQLNGGGNNTSAGSAGTGGSSLYSF